MGAVVVLVALYIAAIAAVGVWATVRVVRRSGEKLGRLRTHVVIHGAVMGGPRCVRSLLR
jgi:hypothetical protein